MRNVIYWGDSRRVLAGMAEESIDCVVTSPPYYGLRDYGHDEQIGLEETPEQYINQLVTVFDGVWRVLKPGGTVWLNLGDSYATSGGNRKGNGQLSLSRSGIQLGGNRPKGYKDKDLMMIPHRVAIALQARGWYVRSDIVWHKPNPMPESVTDRPTKAHEYVFLLTKSARYYYDADAIREPVAQSTIGRGPVDFGGRKGRDYQPDDSDPNYRGGHEQWGRTFDYKKSSEKGRNKRSVWSISTKPYSGAHFAVMPLALVDLCVKAGCPAGGVVMDPFGGSGTVAVSAIQTQRDYVLIELNPSYIALAHERIRKARNADPFRETVHANGVTQLTLFG